MAYKSFKKLSARNQSALITQLLKLVNYYTDLYSSRDRVYLRNLSQQDGSIYWLEDKEGEVTAMAIVDPGYTFKASGIKITTLGHLIASKPGYIDRLIEHIFTDYDDKTIGLISRKSVNDVLEIPGLVELSPFILQQLWPDLASTLTDYFNSDKETFAEALDRKKQFLYLKLTEPDKRTLTNTNPKLLEYLNQAQEV